MLRPLYILSSVTGTGAVNISFADGAPFRFFAASFGIPVAELAMIESNESRIIQRCKQQWE